ncbi:MAG: hypothetical protein COT73_06795 [Bdellovibrio sp. CG10_big_fil_rev_8_21_14_0_10_47_8]|nr:MAG: hypothetical protein COT73_06795 [Bdellovibrio sp. CG10_big_fil_rev_8_21_14_0_10_47_8]
MDYREAKKWAEEAQALTDKLLKKSVLTKEETAQMVTAAQAQVYIWSRAGTPLLTARAHRLACKVFCHLNETKMASMHAQLSDYFLKQAGDRRVVDEALGLVAFARVSAQKGERDLSSKFKAEALQVCEQIKDPQEKQQVEEELQGLSVWESI